MRCDETIQKGLVRRNQFTKLLAHVAEVDHVDQVVCQTVLRRLVGRAGRCAGLPLQKSAMIRGIRTSNRVIHDLKACNPNTIHDVGAPGEMAGFDEASVSCLFDQNLLHC